MSISLQLALILSTNQPLSFGLLFLRDTGLLSNFVSVVFGETLLPKCSIDHGIMFGVV